MVHHHSFLNTNRETGVIIRTAQVIAINSFGQIIMGNTPIGKQGGFLKQLHLLILLVIVNLNLFLIMELAVCDFMDSGGNGLYLAHAFPDGDALAVG